MCVHVCLAVGGVGCQLTGNRSDEWAHISAEREGKEMDGDLKRWALLQARC